MTPDADPFRIGPVTGDGPAVLCLHGLTGTPFEVRPPAEALADAGFACFGPALPGHCGDPTELLTTSADDWLDAVTAGWDALADKHERVYVMGLSLGGLLALALAQRRPVAGALVLAAPVSLGWLVNTVVPLLWRIYPMMPKGGSAIFDDEARAVHPGYSRMPLPAVRELLALARRVEPALPEITSPVRLIYSRRDPTVPISNAERVRGQISNAPKELYVLEDSAHVITVDRERELVDALAVDFLVSLERDRD